MAQFPSNKPISLSRQPLPSPALWSQSPVSLPSSPGVYWFIGKNADVLYVGKAKNLHHRLKSYARSHHLLPKTAQLVKNTHQVRYQILDSELLALLVEAELIRAHQPHYNSLLKDDKSPLYIVTTKSVFPRVLVSRRQDLSHMDANRKAFGPYPSSRQVKEVVRIARRLFPFCNANDTDIRKRKACFYSHIGLCPGVCTGTITRQDYQKNIRRLEQFLSGQHKRILSGLTREIEAASHQKNYELAQTVKKTHDAIIYVTTHYRLNHEQIVPQLTQDKAQQALLSLKRLFADHHLNLGNFHRIEVYDVANLMGQSAAVSMVVALNGSVSTSAYRHFTIKTLSTPNDVGMLKEALIRRQKHPEWGMPDLIIVDGGIPQVNGAKQVLTWSIPVLGLAKHPDRIILPTDTSPSPPPLLLNPAHPGAALLITLRNEAHRFSRRLHHRLDQSKLFQ